ncbi:MAG: hypothetical protein HY578_02890 [Nitrospinae bacterium]|nr:hypothetical protein [Nitrospinota bacterium]
MQEMFKSLEWYRFSVTLLNIRTSPQMSSHPVSIINAIIKGVSKRRIRGDLRGYQK